ncbi:MAG: aminopeptidase [Bacteroidetes bacterium]|jgi:aminopeptidase N|nr:aminopeptidase [Bacteroidota bacterium]
MNRIKHVLLLLSLTLFISSCGLFGIHFKVHNPKKPGKYPKFNSETILLGELTPIRKNFNVVFYDLDILVDASKKTIGGWVETHSVALKDIDSIQLDLDQQFIIEGIKWKSREGEDLKYSRKERAIFIKLKDPIREGEQFSVHVKYTGKPVVARKPPWSGGMVWKKDKEGNAWCGPVCETDGSSTWFPCKDHTSDEPDSVKLRFTIPDSSLSVVSNGVFKGREQHNNSASFNWKISYPINLYNITFYLGNFAKIEDHYTGINSKELKLSYYVLKPNLDKARKHFPQVKEQLRIYEQTYGEYPWYNDGFKLVESPYAGQEHQTAIAYGNGYKNDLNGKDDYIILHEMGHEWFGNAITAEDLADVWLQEGITTYGEALYLEKKYSYEEALNHLLFYKLVIKNKYPLVGPVGRRYFDYHDGDVYTKGAWLMHTLRKNINNDTLFFAILRTFYQENKMKTCTSKTFIETVNRMTGKSYDWFFNHYLYKNEAPVFEYQYTSEGFYYRWSNVAADFDQLAVPLKFGQGANRVEVFPDVQIQKYTPAGPTNIFYIYDDNALFKSKKNKMLEHLYNETGK